MSSSSIHPPQTEEIPLSQWVAFLAEFTRENRGAHARLEIVGSDEEPFDQVETEGRTLDRISADSTDREHTVWISFGLPDEEQLTHRVHHAAAMRVLPASPGAGPILEIEAQDGTKTLLELEPVEEHALAD